jgi:hypothetical protein
MATPEQMQQARDLFPGYAWMLDVPELADIIGRAAEERWIADRIQGALQGTNWWRERNTVARRWQELVQTDPAEARRQQLALALQMRQWAASVGLQVSSDEASYIAGLTLAGGASESEWKGSIYQQFAGVQGQQPTTVREQMGQMAAKYAVPLSDQIVDKWSQDLATGMVDMNVYESYLREQAKSLFPGLANAIDRGITVDQYVQPYAQIAVQELGVNPAEIDWRDPKWNTAIHRIDPKTGVPTAMSLSDWTKELRTNSVYGFDQTQRAQEQAAALGQALLQRMGRAA